MDATRNDFRPSKENPQIGKENQNENDDFNVADDDDDDRMTMTTMIG